MKYKVIFVGDWGPAGDTSTAHSFYTRSQAVAACQSYIEVQGGSSALLWDGSTWTRYQ